MPFDEQANWALPCEPKVDHRKCTWAPDTKEKCPHIKRELTELPKIYPDITYAIGNTPMVRLNRVPQSLGVECEVIAKCEYLSAGGSVKDRIGLRMVKDAEDSGRLKKGDIIIEPTSGNTGIGITMVSAAFGYENIIVMPEKMSKEKENVLAGLGAKVIRTPTSAAFDDPDSLIMVSKKIMDETPNSHILDQYRNPSNPMAHYDGTAEEIYRQCEGKLDAIVMAAGTGGTISGVGRRFKELLPEVSIVGVDPIGSILSHDMNEPAAYEVEGIGYDFLPAVMERKVIDKWVPANDRDSFLMARRIIKEEGMLVGGSSGSALAGAIKFCKDLGLGRDKRVVVVFPDSIRNYITKFVSDDWMIARNFLDVPEPSASHKAWKMPLSALNLPVQPDVPLTMPLAQVSQIVETAPGKCVITYTEDRLHLFGVITQRRLLRQLLKYPDLDGITARNAVDTNCKPVPAYLSVGTAATFLQGNDFVLVGPPMGEDEGAKYSLLTVGLLSSVMLNFLASSDQ